MSTATYNIIRPATHAEWLEQRKLGIGSSEVGTILGVNPWQTPYQLWRIKMGIDPPTQENSAMRWGHYLEEGVAQCFQGATGYQVIKASAGDWLAVDKHHDFLRVSPDRTYWLGESRSRTAKGIVECKSTRLKFDSVPQHWFAQLMYQLGVMQYREGYLAWVNRETLQFDCMHVDFDRDLYSLMVDKLTQFWEINLKQGVEPDIVTVEDVMIKYPKSSAGKVVEVTDELMADINELKMLKPQLDALTKSKKEIEDRIKAAMQDAETLCLPGTLTDNPKAVCTWKSARDSVKFDADKFRADNPELYDQYCVNTPGSRRFILK